MIGGGDLAGCPAFAVETRRRVELARHRLDDGRQQVTVVDQDGVLLELVDLGRLGVPEEHVRQRDVAAAGQRGRDDEVRAGDVGVEPGRLRLPQVAVLAAADQRGQADPAAGLQRRDVRGPVAAEPARQVVREQPVGQVLVRGGSDRLRGAVAEGGQQAEPGGGERAARRHPRDQRRPGDPAGPRPPAGRPARGRSPGRRAPRRTAARWRPRARRRAGSSAGWPRPRTSMTRTPTTSARVTRSLRRQRTSAMSRPSSATAAQTQMQVGEGGLRLRPDPEVRAEQDQQVLRLRRDLPGDHRPGRDL